MPYDVVQKWCLETGSAGSACGEIIDHLLQAKQFEMIDQECTEKHDEPAEQR